MADALGRCNCRTRREAEKQGEFFFDPELRAWVFPDVRRELFPRAKYYASDPEDHSGEPFRWELCPWCGLELPTSPKPKDGDQSFR